MRTKKRRSRETDAENRERAILVLQKVKEKEKRKGLIPFRLCDENNTILMISPKLSLRQRLKLKDRMLHRLSKRHAIIED